MQKRKSDLYHKLKKSADVLGITVEQLRKEMDEIERDRDLLRLVLINAIFKKYIAKNQKLQKELTTPTQI